MSARVDQLLERFERLWFRRVGRRGSGPARPPGRSRPSAGRRRSGRPARRRCRARSPRATFVSSRQTATSRSGSSSASSASVAGSRRGDSNATSVVPALRRAPRAARPSSAAGSRAKCHSSAGSPDATSAVIAADGPGQHLDRQPGRDARAHQHVAGSDTSGIPASDTSATTAPPRIFSTSSAARARSLCSWYETSRAFTPYRSSSTRVRRVSSHATTSASRSADSTRRVMSSRFPIGVGHTTSLPLTAPATPAPSARRPSSPPRRRSGRAGRAPPPVSAAARAGRSPPGPGRGGGRRRARRLRRSRSPPG